ncbi:gag-proteinase polyprotein [Cucumis melo var. makuwa]|uniref:Gag-proteinase polyprotein n=1 Tax=Cucumis melo var. makuwa TaxID=1194695 RepID=A0A5A7VGN0_CUCMM|nr:gag-proteinase polyprotein [Cucumis melo var. makuwa]TYK08726.1 gag-proteinase polyprotein [Cucumis melo var. makuwa]
MDGIREGNSTTRPPLLDGGNYGYWKSRMIAFLMSLDMRSWKAIISGWEHPTKKDEFGKVTRKSELKWMSEEDDATVGNSRALNTLFNVVDQNIFKLINTYKFAKAAWEILEVAYEGTSNIKMSRMQILTSHFKALKMEEDETIAEFIVRVLNIANELYTLGEKMSDSKLVRKVLRSLPSRFNIKITTIEEANDLSKMKLDELFGSLRTFELHLGDGESRRKIGLALTLVKEKLAKECKVSQNEDSLAKSMVLLTKKMMSEERRIMERQNLRRMVKESDAMSVKDEEDYSESNDEEVEMTLISITTINEEGVENLISQAPDQQATMSNESLNEAH